MSTPPFSIEAEMSVIGGMFVANETIPLMLEILDDEDFYREQHRRVFRAMVRLWEQGEVADAVTLVTQLQAQGDLEFTGGAGYLSDLMDAVPTAANIEYHARIVQKFSLRRKLMAAGREIAEIAASQTDDTPEKMQADAERLLAAVSPPVTGRGLVWVKELLWEEMLRIENLHDDSKQPDGIKSGLKAIDDRLGQMEAGDLVILAARPSMGKSALGVCNIAADAAVRQGRMVAVFSLETRRDRMVTRLVQSEARVNLKAAKMRKGLRDDEYPRLSHAAGFLNTAKLYLDDTPGLTCDQMRGRLRKIGHEREPVKLVVVDYLQLMEHPGAKDTRTEVTKIGQGLKRIAQEFECPVLALSQLSRAVEARPDKRPMMSDLRESGTLEQDADVIMLLYRPEYYFGPTKTEGRGKDVTTVSLEGKAEVNLAKVRDGATGPAHLIFEKEYTRFSDWK